jgi:hypothetical protein
VKDERERAHGKKSLKNFFLDDWSMVLVLDDREDVWQIENQHKHLWQVCLIEILKYKKRIIPK